jgi:hypothetical protein
VARRVGAKTKSDVLDDALDTCEALRVEAKREKVTRESAAGSRGDFPVLRPNLKASKADAIAAVGSEEGRQVVLANFDRDVTAASSAASSASTWRTWVAFHVAWVGEKEPVLPLTAAKVRCVSACFEEGAYKSFAPYLSKAKEMHILGGFEWTPLLEMCFRKASHSVLRGIGAARQSRPFDLLRGIEVAEADCFELGMGAPIGWRKLLVVGTFIVMREIEIAFAKAEHTRIDEGARRVTLLLPVSKKDPRAVGCERAWSCLCGGTGVPRPDCPFHAVLGQLELLQKEFGCPLPCGLPLFPCARGQHIDKALVVAALEATVSGYGESIRSASGARLYGGHSFRATGAQRLAALGVEVIKIMILARWSGDTVLRYIKDAPLANLPNEVLALEGKRDLVKMVAKTADGAEVLMTKVGNLETHVKTLAAERAVLMTTLEAKAAAAEGPPFVSNGVSGRARKIHRILVYGIDLPPQEWRARCGFRFAFCGFTRHASLDKFASEVLCKKCCPNEVAAGSSDAPCSPSSAASSTSSEISDDA